mgnify:CR=1 FL=1
MNDWTDELKERYGAKSAGEAVRNGTTFVTDSLDAMLACDEIECVIEATGHPSGVTQGLQMIRKLGTFVEFSVFNEPVTVNWTIIGDTKELNIHGSHLGPYCYPKTIAAIADVDVALRISGDGVGRVELIPSVSTLASGELTDEPAVLVELHHACVGVAVRHVPAAVGVERHERRAIEVRGVGPVHVGRADRLQQLLSVLIPIEHHYRPPFPGPC